MTGQLSLLLGRFAHVEKGALGGTLDVSTFWSSLAIFFAAFFAFLAVLRTSFVFLDIRRGPPTTFAAWTFGRMGSSGEPRNFLDRRPVVAEVTQLAAFVVVALLRLALVGRTARV